MIVKGTSNNGIIVARWCADNVRKTVCLRSEDGGRVKREELMVKHESLSFIASY